MLAPIRCYHFRHMGHEDFKRPPVTEVSIGAVFGPVQGFSQAHVALVWDKIRENYPVAEDQPPLPLEQEPPAAGRPQLNLSLMALPPLRRTLFNHKDSDRLIQIQQDGLILNWRKGQQPYPRYGSLRNEFESIWKKFVQVVSSVNLVRPVFHQVQVSYSNVFELPHSNTFGIFVPNDVVQMPSKEYDYALKSVREQSSWQSEVQFGDSIRTQGILTCLLMRGGVTGLEGSDENRVFFRQTFQSFKKTEELDAFLSACDDGHDLIVENFSHLLSSELRRQFGGNR